VAQAVAVQVVSVEVLHQLQAQQTQAVAVAALEQFQAQVHQVVLELSYLNIHLLTLLRSALV
jgi:hypothetical protein